MAISVSKRNRPIKFGEKDRREFITQETEVAFQSQNDANGNPIYLGRAKAGTATDEQKWQLQYLTYDGTNTVTSITWPQNPDGRASTEYEFSWDDRASYTYS
jgi:hypothetical protein